MTGEDLSLDKAGIGTLLKRYLDVGQTVGGAVFRAAGERYGGQDKKLNAQRLKDALGQIKGPLMKVAQFLATIPDAIPPEYAQEILSLQSQAPSMGENFVKRRMAAELGSNWQKHFRHFDLKACAAASLGQVHKAFDERGNPLACKLQYPQMESLIAADLAQLRQGLTLYHLWNKALDTDDIQSEIQDRLQEELDYVHEAKQVQIFHALFKNDPFIRVPRVYPDLSTRKLLTLEWQEGTSLFSYKDHGQSFRNQVGRRLFQAWYIPFCQRGILHADPHPGNYLITEDTGINLLDFGCVRHFSSLFLKGVITLYKGLLHNDEDQVIHAYAMWGFQNLGKEQIDIMTRWAKLLYDPLLDDRVRPLQKDFSGAIGRKTAAVIHKALHQVGGIRPPREFLFMDRAAVGLGGGLMHLRAECNWHQMFEEILETAPSWKERLEDLGDKGCL